MKDVGDERRKGCLDIDILLGAALHEAPALLAGELRAHIIGDHLVRHIDLVADQHYYDVFVAVILDLLVPRLERQETVPIADIVDKKSRDRAPEEDRCESLESLLPQCIPDVQLGHVLCASDRHILALVFDLLGGLVLLTERPLHKPVRNTCFPYLFIADQDHFPGEVWLVI